MGASFREVVMQKNESIFSQDTPGIYILHPRTLSDELDDRIIVDIVALKTEGWIPMCSTSGPINISTISMSVSAFLIICHKNP